MRNPNFLVLDEPTNDLDIVNLNRCLKSIYVILRVVLS